MLVGLFAYQLLMPSSNGLHRISATSWVESKDEGDPQAYKGKATVSAPANLRLIDIDEYPRMAQRSTTAVTRNNPAFRPPDWLFMDQAYSSFWLWL